MRAPNFLVIHPIVDVISLKIQMSTPWWHYRIRQVSSNGVEFILCGQCVSVPTFMAIQSKISLWTKVMDQHDDMAISRAMA